MGDVLFVNDLDHIVAFMRCICKLENTRYGDRFRFFSWLVYYCWGLSFCGDRSGRRQYEITGRSNGDFLNLSMPSGSKANDVNIITVCPAASKAKSPCLPGKASCSQSL